MQSKDALRCFLRHMNERTLCVRLIFHFPQRFPSLIFLFPQSLASLIPIFARGWPVSFPFLPEYGVSFSISPQFGESHSHFPDRLVSLISHFTLSLASLIPIFPRVWRGIRLLWDSVACRRHSVVNIRWLSLLTLVGKQM